MTLISFGILKLKARKSPSVTGRKALRAALCASTLGLGAAGTIPQPALAAITDAAANPSSESPYPEISEPAPEPAPTEADAGMPASGAVADMGETAAPESSGPEPETAGPELAGPPRPDVEMYGPPLPKSKGGKLPQIAWPDAPPQVPPALDEAIRLVTRNYPSAKAARASLRAAAAEVRAAKWLRFPSLSANLAYLDTNNNPIPQVVAELPLWTGGRIGSGIRRAKADEDSTSAQYVETAQTLALTTMQTYFQIASLTLREQLLADSLTEHGRLVSTMERRVKQEVSPLADLELARSRAAQIEQQYTITRAQRQTALRLMAELVADPDYDLGPVPYFDRDLDLPNREALEDQAVAYDPSIKRLQAQADVARADRDSIRASILPQLNAQYSYDDFYKSRVGLSLRAQTQGGLSQFSQVEASRQRIDAALEQARVAEQQLRRDVASDIIEYESSRVRAGISLGASETAAKVSASYMRQFIAGRRSWLDVMNALREAVSAQIDRSDAEISAMASAVKLIIESGRWRPEFPHGDATKQN